MERRPSTVPGSWASNAGVRRAMLANRRADTKPEIALRRVLHARGLRFRKDHQLALADRRVRPDVVFTRAKVAVFLDGCFWHRCPEHATTPATNTDYWIAKFERNVERDRAVDRSLTAEGWTVVRVWEHEDSGDAADRVAIALGRAP
jgi:DNA mismatch endonuclease (patch repair protein)